MGPQKLLLTFLLCAIIFLIIGSEVVQSSSHNVHHHRHHRALGFAPKKLFVFGDSYADTGNNGKRDHGWNKPYGTTFPGKPSGRFSDGRIFTDFLARSLGLKSPIAYKWRKYLARRMSNGMNFAFGGTGVFDTLAPYPNMTAQIELFRTFLNESVFNVSELRNSVAHVSLAGNDYSAYLAKGGSVLELTTFIPKVVSQLVTNLERINNLGVKKISVTNLAPLGCLPGSTIQNSFQKCNSTANEAVKVHNFLLQQAISELNNKYNGGVNPFVLIDLFTAFSTVIQNKGSQQGNIRFDEPLKPCCMGMNTTYDCGDVDANGNKMYTSCKDPKSSFFWDLVHPTQTGWHAVLLTLKSTLQELRH